MNLNSIKTNMTEMTIGDNKILFSYKTPVAIQNRFGLIFVTEKFWSKTTSRHINEWLKLRNPNIPGSNFEMPQEYFDNLINE